MSQRAARKRRSRCPLNAAVEMVGDRWSLLVVRDMMLGGARSYADLLAMHEDIATNILADRLRKLAKDGIIASKPYPADGRKRLYALTKKGLALAPALTELVLWASAHETTGRQALIREMRKDRTKFLARVAREWKAAR